jgi:predicted dehydrogenase
MQEVTYAIVGCGSVSGNRYFNHMDAVARAGGRLVAVCDRSEERASPRAREFAVPCFTDVEELLSKTEFDLLVNLTNVQAHYDVSMLGLQAGRHVYSQKPMTSTLEEANRLIEEASKRKLVIVAEDASPIMPVYLTIKKLLDEGVIGKVVWLRSNMTHKGPAIIDNWPTDPSWFYKKGAGPLRDVGIEALATITAILGPAKMVTAMSGINQPEVVVRGGPNKGKRIGVDEDDITLVLMDFGESTFAMLDTAWVNVAPAHPPHSMVIYGQKGIISLLSGGHPKAGALEFDLRLHRDEPDLGIRGWSKVEVVPPAGPLPQQAVLGLVHAIECLTQDRKPILSGERARHCIEIVEKAFEAAHTGVTQALESTL